MVGETEMIMFLELIGCVFVLALAVFLIAWMAHGAVVALDDIRDILRDWGWK